MFIKGYVTERDLPYLEKQLNKQFTVVIIEAEDADNEKHPWCLNNAFARPAESLVKMYSLPGAHDIDPTPITDFSLPVFRHDVFGCGLRTYAMILATTFAIKKPHPRPRFRQSMRFSVTANIHCLCGGSVYGSLFLG